MKSFIETFRENIPYIADEIYNCEYNRKDELISPYQIIQDALIDWISEYQSDIAESKQEKQQYWDGLDEEELYKDGQL